MRKSKILTYAIGLLTLFLMASCSSVQLTSWKDQSAAHQVKEVVIVALFDRLDYSKPFEENLVAYFESKGLKGIKSLDFMAPGQKYSVEEFKQKVSELGADAVVVFTFKGKDVSVNYTPPTYTGFYRGYYGGAYSMSPGYYSESTTAHIQSNLYSVADEKLIWTGDLSVTDPSSVQTASLEMAKAIYADWVKNQLVAPVE